MAHTRPARLLVSLACAGLAVVALPAVATAQPANDDYLSSIRINEPGTTLPGTSTRNGTIVLATVQTDLFNGAPGGPIPENIGCERPGFPAQTFGDTVWWDFYPHRPGFVRVVAESASFTPVVGVMPFSTSTAVPDSPNYWCAVGSLGNATLDYPVRLQEGGGYTIQLGAADGVGVEGPYTLSVYFNPDTDRDGLVDSGDLCPNEGGGAALGGCPDGDGDGVIDGNDRCQGPKGTVAHAGCPDSDRDGKIDPDDACRGESTRGKRDRNDNGCPDRELLKPETKLTPGSYCTGSVCHGIRVNKLVVSEIPRRTRVSVSCSKHACKTVAKTVGKSRHVRFFHGQALKAGVGLTITISRKGFVGRRVTYWIQSNDLKKGSLSCLKSGRPVRCTNKLLVR